MAIYEIVHHASGAERYQTYHVDAANYEDAQAWFYAGDLSSNLIRDDQWPYELELEGLSIDTFPPAVFSED